MIQHYNRDFYLTNTDKTIDEQNLSVQAFTNSGTAWNRIIGGVIVDQLHEKILDVPSTNLLSLVDILTLVQTGWLYTASQLVSAQKENLKNAGISDEVLTWFIDACLTADDTENS